MKVYCLTKICRRQFIAEHFGFEMTSVNNNCCDNCASTCDNNETLCAIDNAAIIFDEQAIAVKEALNNLFELLVSTSNDVINPALTTGANNSLAIAIASKHQKYINKSMLATDYNHLSTDLLNYIYQVLEQIHT